MGAPGDTPAASNETTASTKWEETARSEEEGTLGALGCEPEPPLRRAQATLAGVPPVGAILTRGAAGPAQSIPGARVADIGAVAAPGAEGGAALRERDARSVDAGLPACALHAEIAPGAA